MPSVAKPKSKKTKLEFEAIGTAWTIEFDSLATDHQAVAQEISKSIADRISQFDHDYSRFRPDSWVLRAGSKPGSYTTPADFEPMFRLYQQMYELTNGLVTPLIGDALERAGYNASYDLQPTPLRAIPDLNEALQFHDNTLHVKYACCLDFGAAGKGYLVDIIAKQLHDRGIPSFIIDAGGDMFVASPALTTSTPVVTVALEDPRDPSKAIGEVHLIAPAERQALCGSASNRRKWADFHHIINPKSLRPANDVLATWVVADSTMLADGLATCLFFTDPALLANAFDFEYLRVMADNTIQVSPSFPGRVFK